MTPRSTPLIDQAEAQGTLVTVMNTELPKAEAKYASKGTGYVGATLYDAGAALANEAIARDKLQSGSRVFVWGLMSQPGRGERTKGIVDTLKKAGMKVDYLEINNATNADPSAGVPIFTGYVSKHPDVKAMFIDHGNLTSTIPTYMKAANLEPGSVYMAGFDMSPATVQGVQKGYISLVIDQQEWLQGYFGDRAAMPEPRSTASAACTSTPVAGSSTSRTSTRSRRSSRSRSGDVREPTDRRRGGRRA